MTYGQMGTVCPQCGRTDAVHSIQELAELARAHLGQQRGSAGGPGWAGQPGAGPQPGWAAEPQAGALPGPGGRRSGFPPVKGPGGDASFGDSGSIVDDITGAAMGAAAGAAARFIGRAISRRVQDRFSQQVLPAMAARQSMLETQIAIAERHPDLCACLNDQVVFLTGGSRTQPMPNLATVTVDQADSLVAQLRNG